MNGLNNQDNCSDSSTPEHELSTHPASSSSPLEVGAPPQRDKRIVVAFLLLISLTALSVAAFLLPAARFALVSEKPTNLGALKHANLSQAPEWIKASGIPSAQALSFRRRGVAGSFRLVQLESRKEVWVVLRVHDRPGVSPGTFVPPANFSGRLLPLHKAGLMYAPITQIIEKSKSGKEVQYMLLEGESPRSHRDSLFAALLLTLLGIGSLAFAWRFMRSPPPSSTS